MKGLLADPVEGPVDDPLSAPPDWDDPPTNEHAHRALRFIQACPHTKGELADGGKALGDTWLPWQERTTRHLFGAVDAGGKRRYRTLFWEGPKKCGKSHWAAAVMLYLAGPGSLPGAELYSAGFKHKQAMVVWRIAVAMIRRADWMRDRFEITDYQGNWSVKNPVNDAFYEPVTRKAAGQHGWNPFAVCFDELHTQPDRELWDTIDDSMGAWTEPLLLAITNAGHDRESICYQQREYAIENNRDGFDDSFLGVVYGTDEEHEGVGDEEVWRSANPGVPVTVDLSTIRQKAETAKRQPSKLNPFQRWQLGMWTRQDSRWISPDDWAACAEDYAEDDLVGRSEISAGICFGGLDIGSVSDLTAWLMIFPDPEDAELVRLLCRTWCPAAHLKIEENRYADRYQQWAEDGWLEVTTGNAVDYWSVREQVAEDAESFGLVDMGVDTQFQAHQLMIELADSEGISVAGMRTTYSQMTSPCDEFERRILLDPEKGGPKIRHRDNPVLNWAVRNVALRQPDPDRKRPVKENDDAKIDPVVALLMALDRSMRHEGTSRSGYEDHGIRTVGA